MIQLSLLRLLTITLTLTLMACTKHHDAQDDSLNIVLTANVKGLDPIKSNDKYSNAVMSNIYEGLMTYHYLKRPVQLIPSLATNMPEISKDGLTYTFKIKPGVKFQDNEAFPEGKGREVEAKDFIYSWQRLADPKNRSEGFWVLDGKIAGLNEWAEAVSKKTADYSTPIAGLQSPDKYTLVIKLKEPYYQLLYALAMNYTAVVAKEVVGRYGEEYLNHPVGTGPFQLKSWIRNSKIELVRNPTYRKNTYPTEGEPADKEKGLLEDAGKPLPLASRLVFNELVEDQPRWLNFLRGKFDAATIPKDSFDQAIKDGTLSPDLANKQIQLLKQQDADLVYTGFNMRDPVLGKNRRLRQAISMALNNEDFIKKFYNGRAVKANGPIPPDLEGFDPNFKNPYGQFNLKKAKELLAEAGYPKGKGLTFTYDTLTSTTSRQSAERFQQEMAALGIKVNIRTNSWPQFLERQNKADTQIFGAAWGADYPDAQNFLQLFYSKNAPPGPNNTSYSNPEFDKLYEKSLLMPPSPARNLVYQELQKIVAEDAPVSFTAHRKTYTVMHKWLKNYKPNDVIPENYMHVKVDPKERQEIEAKF